MRILNLGNRRSERVSRMVELLEQALGRRAEIRMVPRPAADLMATWAAVDAAHELAGWLPRTPLDVGIPRFVSWFRAYHELLIFACRGPGGMQGGKSSSGHSRA